MNYNFSNLKQSSTETKEWLKREYVNLRTGRASLSILDGVKVESYGAKMPVSQIATISSEGPKTLRIAPWDKTQAKNIEKAIQEADLGLSVVVDDKGLRIHFPDLSEERRLSLAKVSRQKLEEAKIKLRAEREKTWEDIQKKTKESLLTEDDKFRLKNEMQKIVDEFGKELDELAGRKEKEIMN